MQMQLGSWLEPPTEKSVAANYSHTAPLRALGLRGNLDIRLRGRSDASWINNENGLQRFWQDAFPDGAGLSALL